MAVEDTHPPVPSNVVRHLTEMFVATLNPYFAWAVVLHCYEEEVDLPHEVLMHLASVATLLLGEDTIGNRDPSWGANRDNHRTYERALRFGRQVKKLEQFNDLKEIGSDRAAKWFADDMLRLMADERRKGTRPKDEIYRRIGKRIGLSESAVEKRCRKAERGEEFDFVLDRNFVSRS